MQVAYAVSKKTEEEEKKKKPRALIYVSGYL